MSTCRILAAAILALPICEAVWAQQVTIGTPNTSVRNSFNEQMGTNFNFGIKGANRPRFDDRGRSAVFGINALGNPTADIQVNQGGFGAVRPAFGGFDPAAQTTGGIGFRGSGFRGSLGFSLGQGSNTTVTSQTPMVTTMNGQPGSFSDQVQQPFVTSVTPIVNGRLQHPRFGYNFVPQQVVRPPSISPIYERYRRLKQEGVSIRPRREEEEAVRAVRPAVPRTFRDRLDAAQTSTAGQPTLSVAEIRRQQAAADAARNSEATQVFQRAVDAERDGKTGMAKIYYRMASRDATGKLKQRAEEGLRRVSRPSSASRTSPGASP